MTMQTKTTLGLLLTPALILAVPLLGNWPWTLSDFVIMGILLYGAVGLYLLLARMAGSSKSRLVIGFGILGAVLWLWAELAVGVFTNWGS